MSNSMVIEKLTSFVDVLGLASLGSPLDLYKQQEMLITLCREKGKPFFASMPVRSQFHCTKCGIRSTQVEIQFEDPSRPKSDAVDSYLWGKPVGLFFQIDQSVLHDVIAHGEPMPLALIDLINGVGT